MFAITTVNNTLRDVSTFTLDFKYRATARFKHGGRSLTPLKMIQQRSSSPQAPSQAPVAVARWFAIPPFIVTLYVFTTSIHKNQT